MRRPKMSLAAVFVSASVLLMWGCNPNTRGVKIYEEGALDGYTLLSISGYGAPPPLLFDMHGNIVHPYSEVEGLSAKLMPGGTIISGKGRENTFLAAEYRSLVQENWDGTVEWSFSEWEQLPGGEWSSRQHHDLQREGNPVGYYAPGQNFVEHGHTLVLAHANETRPEISSILLIDDIIYEIDWAGYPVFEWHAADHIDEFGFDEAARAAIASHGGDWLHSNSISWLGENQWYDNGDERFHPRNIIFDSREAGFIAIIDYRTGGLVWRVGPDYSAGNPEAALGPFIGQHHAHMIPRGLPGAGHILVFDNGGSRGYGGPDGGPKYTRDYSRVVEFDPTTLEIVWEYSPANGDHLPFSLALSGAQRLPNGNTLITSGNPQTLLEVTPERQVVWQYDHDNSLINPLYRAYRVPPEWLPENPGGYALWE